MSNPVVSQGQAIFTHGLQVRDRISFQDAERIVKSGETLFPGRAVSLFPTLGVDQGKIVTADDTSTFIYGLTDTNLNIFANDTFSATGEFGSGKANVITRGRVIIRPNVYLQSDQTQATVQSYDPSQTYVPGNSMTVDATAADTNNTPNVTYKGRLTLSTKAGAGTVVVARVLSTFTSLNPEMEIFIVAI